MLDQFDDGVPSSAPSGGSTNYFLSADEARTAHERDVASARAFLRGKLTPEQREVFDCVVDELPDRSEPLLLVVPAAPGSGKTGTLASVLAMLLLMRRMMLSLSFMNTSQKTLKSRVTSLASECSQATGVPIDLSPLERDVVTAHAHALRSAGRAVDDGVEIVEESVVVDRLARTVDADVESGTLPQLSREAIAEAISVRRRVRFLTLMKEPDASAHAHPHDVAAVERVNCDMTAARAFDFDLLIKRCSLNPDETVVRPGDIVFVDEAQDCTATIAAILRGMLSKGAHVVLVGDPAQGICMFAGSSTHPLKQIAETAPCQVRVARLTRNFRSTKQVVGLYEELVDESDRELRGTSVATKSGPEPLVHIYSASAAKDSQPDVDVVEQVKAWLDEGIDPNEIVVMRHANYYAREREEGGLYKSLCAAKVRVTINGGKTTSNLPIQALALLQLAVGASVDSVEDAVRVVNDAVHVLGGKFSKDVKESVSRAAAGRVSLLDVVDAYNSPAVFKATVAASKPGNKQKTTNLQKGRELLKNGLAAVRREVETVYAALESEEGEGGEEDGESEPKRQKVEVTLARLAAVLRPILEARLGKAKSAQNAAAVDQLLDRLRSAVVRVRDDVANVLSAECLRAPETTAAVRIGTIHSFKGDEASHVIVQKVDSFMMFPGVSKEQMAPFAHLGEGEAYRSICDSYKAENAVNGRRLLYVATSRAKTELVLQVQLRGGVDELAGPTSTEFARFVARLRQGRRVVTTA
jgi:superfamily I DNA/RNA helicase